MRNHKSTESLISAKPSTGHWDIFVHVIDNWGDIGVCWRLAKQLHGRGLAVRLWLDRPEALDWMAPGARLAGHDGPEIHLWDRDPQAPAPRVAPSQVLIAAFGCEVQAAWVLALQAQGGVWLNLEYLSAEGYVERCHRLGSPQSQGALQGRILWFFYPGFTPATGGLLRDPERELAQATARPENAPPRVTLFCYEPGALGALLHDPALAQAHWCVAPGRPAAAWAQACATHQLPPSAQVSHLPYLPQDAFDRQLQGSDLNLVRGEDSLVQALWSGQALVWHLYPQEDQAHHAKLEAFLDWLDAPQNLRDFHRVWNGLTHGPLPKVDLPRWRGCIQAARQRLWAQEDLVTQILRFVEEKR